MDNNDFEVEGAYEKFIKEPSSLRDGEIIGLYHHFLGTCRALRPLVFSRAGKAIPNLNWNYEIAYVQASNYKEVLDRLVAPRGLCTGLGGDYE